MKSNALKQFVTLRNALTAEKERLEQRLAEINAAFSNGAIVGVAAGQSPVRFRRKKKRMSAEQKAKIAETQRKRWAERRQKPAKDK